MRAPCARLPLLLLALTAAACDGTEDLSDPTGPDLVTAAATPASRLLQWVAPAPPFATPASSGAYGFGTVAVNATSPAVTFTIRNNGDRATSALAVALPSGPFAITSNGCAGISLGKGKTCRLVVTFTPTGATAYTGVALTVSSRKPDATAAVTLAGTGQAAFTVQLGIGALIWNSSAVYCTVRDRNDAPIVGINPTFTTTAGRFASPLVPTTDATGRAEEYLFPGAVMTVGCTATVNGVSVSDTKEVRSIHAAQIVRADCDAGNPPAIYGSLVCAYRIEGMLTSTSLWGPLEGMIIEFSGTRPDGSTFRETLTTNSAGEVNFSTGLGDQAGWFEYTVRIPGLGNISTTRFIDVIWEDMTECTSDGDSGGYCTS